MNNQQAYNVWAHNYDTVQNRTRDLEASAIKKILSRAKFSEVLEIGCGTGKNTEWLANKAIHVTSVDFSIEMLNKAKEKIKLNNVDFIHADITKAWTFTKIKTDLITCSLILEHIKDIDFVFNQASHFLKSGAQFYIGELHPFKQYDGSKARFDSAKGTFELECFVHHISDYIAIAKHNDLHCDDIQEWFDDNDRKSIPRLITLLFKKR